MYVSIQPFPNICLASRTTHMMTLTTPICIYYTCSQRCHLVCLPVLPLFRNLFPRWFIP